MFSIIPPHKRSKKQAQFDQMRLMLNRILPNGICIPENDPFDTDESVYVIVQSDAGEVVAACRLNPTTGPHMFTSLFPNVDTGRPYSMGKDTWECSLFVIDKETVPNPIEQLEIHSRLSIGLTIFCLDNQITKLCWLAHPKFSAMVRSVWKAEVFGFSNLSQDEQPWICAMSTIESETLDRLLDSHRGLGIQVMGVH